MSSVKGKPETPRLKAAVSLSLEATTFSSSTSQFAHAVFPRRSFASDEAIQTKKWAGRRAVSGGC